MSTFFANLQKILPQHGLTRLMGRLANSPCTWLKNIWIRYFIRCYRVDLSDAVVQNYRDFPTFNAFFTRHLNPSSRPITSEPAAIASPADSTISEYGDIQQGQLLQAKGINYSVTALLGGDAATAARFANGSFITLYLAPRDYHRVHMPLSAQLQETTYVPGNLFSVNNQSAATILNLFARNERLICDFQHDEQTRFALIMVGAMIVGGIHTTWGGTITAPRRTEITKQLFATTPSQHIQLAIGQEMGYFQLGSTVILLFEQRVEWLDTLAVGSAVRMGQCLGQLKK